MRYSQHDAVRLIDYVCVAHLPLLRANTPKNGQFRER